jgi:hypothetical protein
MSVLLLLLLLLLLLHGCKRSVVVWFRLRRM